MRLLAAGLCALAAVPVWGQSGGAWSAVRTGIRQGLDTDRIERPASPRVLEPTTLPFRDTAREGPLPEPLVSDGRFELRNANSGGLVRGRLQAKGAVEFLFRGYQVLADEVEGDLETQVFDLVGNVSVVGRGATVTGAQVRVNFESGRFRAIDSAAELDPSWTQGRLVQDLFIRGRETSGFAREFRALDGLLTTCNLDHPHYTLEARDLELRVGRRVILRDARLNILGRTVLRAPFLSIPLNRDERYTPEVGRSPDEGWYLKNRFGIPIRGDNLRNTLDARLDLFEKLGTGFGAEYGYESRFNQGNLRAYGLVGRGSETFEAALQHRQTFGSATLNLEGDLQRQNYLAAPENTLSNVRAEFAIPRGPNRSALTFSRSSNLSPGFESVQQTVSLQDSRRWDNRTRTDVTVAWQSDLSRFQGSQSNERRQIDVRFRGQNDFDRATAELEYQRSIPIGETPRFFGTLQRTPVFTLSTDATRLFGPQSRLPSFRSELSFGEFSDFGTERPIRRTNFALDVDRSWRIQRRAQLDVTSRFQQGIYSDGTAQYITLLGVNYIYPFTRDTQLNVRYTYNMPFGFTPLQIDQIGRNSELALDVSFRPIRTLLLGAQTGYDFLGPDREQNPWQFVSTRLEYRPWTNLGLRALSTYDAERQQWGSVRLDAAYTRGETFVGLGLRYDPNRFVWGNVNAFVDGVRWGRLRASALLAYNGFLKQFEARHFSFTWDAHCTEFILQVLDNPVGFRPGREIAFFIRLKALPFDTPFGIGRRGQPIGLATGRQ